MRRAVRAIVFRDNNLLVMKRNKFGTHYYTLPGGAINMGEAPEQALAREMAEETGVQLGDTRLVFVEDGGEIYGVQYIYLTRYIGGEPHLSPNSDEASINALGKNTYEPVWISIAELADASFITGRLKDAILQAIHDGFPTQPVSIS